MIFIAEEIYRFFFAFNIIDAIEQKAVNSAMVYAETSQRSSAVNAPSMSQEIRAAITYIQNNYALSLTRETVATACYLSPNYFSTQFRREVGVCFRDYLIQFRMEKATELLRTGVQISEIALKVGYHNRNRFIINFRQRIGCTPSEYRKKMSLDQTP